MAKFAIECPSCGKYVEASTGFFAKKKISCSCGYVINVKLDKFTSRQCPHCGNTVVYDQSAGANAKCPVCHEKLNTLADNQKLEEFTCGQCGIKLMAASSATTYTCPVCDYVNDVNERVTAGKIRNEGLASVIKYEGDNETFIWKHPIEDFNYGSQLIVHESQEAVFFKDGQALDLFGPGRYTLETQQLPLLEKIYSLPTATEGTFHSEVYFINKTVQMGIKWGTPDKVRFIDPLTGVPLDLGACGEMNMQVANSRKLLIKLVGTTSGIAWNDKEGFTKSIQSAFRPLISNAVKVNLSSVIKEGAIDLLEIDEKLGLISDRLKEKIVPGFEEYGLTIPQFYVTNVVLPEDDPNFKRIRDLHTITLQTRMIQAEATVKTAQAQSEAQYRTAQEMSKAEIEKAHRTAELERQTTENAIAQKEAERKVIEAQAEAQAQRLAGLTEAEIMQAKGYNQKDIITAEVQKAYAESIGNMGPAVTTGGGSGSSIVGDMIGLGVGMAAAGTIAPQIGGLMQNFSQQTAAAGMGQQYGQMQNQQYGQMQNQQYGQMQNQQMSQMQNSPVMMQPMSQAETWDCSCGLKGIVGNFCNNCGAKKPAPAEPETWDCTCGLKGIVGNFCNNCGAKKPAPAVPETWDCTCGLKGIVGNFCNNCGKKREDQ